VGEIDRPKRLKTLVETHAEFCEHWLPSWRGLLVEKITAAELKSWNETMCAVTVQQLEQTYGPELSTLPWLPRKRLLIGLEVLTAFESWEREHLLPAAAAHAVWIDVIDRMLPPNPQMVESTIHLVTMQAR